MGGNIMDYIRILVTSGTFSEKTCNLWSENYCSVFLSEYQKSRDSLCVHLLCHIKHLMTTLTNVGVQLTDASTDFHWSNNGNHVDLILLFL